MKLFAIALFAVFCTVNGASPNGWTSENEYRSAVETYLNITLNSRVGTYDPKNVKFFLYTTQKREKVEMRLDYLKHDLENSTYDNIRPTKVIIHDRLFPEYYYKELITAYLAHYHTPVNVITVDYSYYTGVEVEEMKKIYQEIGATVAEFFERLRYHRMTGKNMHVIGHGLGAHIAAVAARGLTSFKFDRVTGLDPVGREFDELKQLPQLQKSDADFVDVIVTNMAGVGSKRKDMGHVNFYPNGGDNQPKSDMLVSHLKSYFYYVESVARGKIFPSYAASSHGEWKNKNYDHDKVNYMGEYAMKNHEGNFYLEVNSLPPYGASIDSTFNSDSRVKIHQTYLSLVLGNELSPWVFTPKNDPSFRKAANNQNTFYSGLGERTDDYSSKTYSEKTLRYSNSKPMSV